jgi:CRP/FNR family cyclic AMP-dependent transcriptional regulator
MAGPASVSTLLLRNVPLFAGLPESQLQLLTRVVGRKSYPRNSTVIAAGDPTDALYIVISGRLKVMMSDDSPRSATVIAIEPCELLTINKADFKKCLQENFDICTGVLKGLVRRLREADKKIGSLALMDVYGRVARLLMEMAETVDGQKVVTKKLPKQDIAKMIGASREMVSRVMKDLQTSGYIEVKAGSIFLREAMLVSEARA